MVKIKTYQYVAFVVVLVLGVLIYQGFFAPKFVTSSLTSSLEPAEISVENEAVIYKKTIENTGSDDIEIYLARLNLEGCEEKGINIILKPGEEFVVDLTCVGVTEQQLINARLFVLYRNSDGNFEVDLGRGDGSGYSGQALQIGEPDSGYVYPPHKGSGSSGGGGGGSPGSTVPTTPPVTPPPPKCPPEDPNCAVGTNPFTAPVITFNAIGGDSNYPYIINTEKSVASINTNVDSVCRWSLIDSRYFDMSNSCSGNGASHTCDINSLAEGIQGIHFSCEDTYGNSNSFDDNLDVIVKLDTQPPLIDNLYPLNNNIFPPGTTTATFSFITSEPAGCEAYLIDSKSSGLDYSCIANTGATSHSCSVDELVPGSNFGVVVCHDGVDNLGRFNFNYIVNKEKESSGGGGEDPSLAIAPNGGPGLEGSGGDGDEGDSPPTEGAVIKHFDNEGDTWLDSLIKWIGELFRK